MALGLWLSLGWCGCDAPACFSHLWCGEGKGCEGLWALPGCGGTFPAGDREGRRVLPSLARRGLRPSLSAGGWLVATGLGLAPDLTLWPVAGTTWGTGSWRKGCLGWKELSWSRLGCASPAASPRRC